MNSLKTGKTIKVLIGQIALTRAPNTLEAVLGSCVGLAIYDEVEGIAAMAHILLPRSGGESTGGLPGKYADLAVPCMRQALMKFGARPGRMRAKFAGGARMFSSVFNNNRMDIGAQNAEAVAEALALYRIPVIRQDTGGPSGRKALFTPGDWEMVVESLASKGRVV